MLDEFFATLRQTALCRLLQKIAREAPRSTTASCTTIIRWSKQKAFADCI